MSRARGSGDARIQMQNLLITRMKSKTDLYDSGGGGDDAADVASAMRLQRAWRQRMQYIYVKELKQQKICSEQREEMRAGLHVECDACASAGKKSADIKSKNLRKAWRDADDLLFKGMARIQMSDRGDNWNERWQEALSLPNKTEMDKNHRRLSLNAVYSDFVHTAVTYGRTIISEYFLHEYMRSVKPKQLGGVAGGKKYLWRGILFKLADGSQGPYGGSDEAAAKAAGHELRGASEYLKTGVGLCVPPMCLLDYKGFRMLAQAHLPLGTSSLKMGTDDGGHTVLNTSQDLNNRAMQAAKKLGLRAHVVGGRQTWVEYRDWDTGGVVRKKRNIGGQLLHTAADVEGHEGADSRLYLLDLARAFPPEDPGATPHLSGMLSVSAKVIVQKDGQRAMSATVTKAHATLVDYDILYQDGTMENGMPAHLLRDLRLFIFYRLMRPEFVRDRGRTVLRKLKLPADYRFQRVVVTNPMMFAIQYGRAAVEKKAPSSGKSSKHRYAAGEVVPSEAPQRRGQGRGNAYANPLTSVAETGDAAVSSDGTADHGAYETFGGEGDEGGEAFGGEASEDAAGLAAGSDGKDHEAWERKAMEFGIEFVVSGDKYYEGFKRSEIEEDEEELKRRGGAGYRPFHETSPADDAAGALGYDNMTDDANFSARGEVGARRRGSGEDTGKTDAAVRKDGRKGFAHHGAQEGEGDGDAGVEGSLEDKREFARGGMLRRETTLGRSDPNFEGVRAPPPAVNDGKLELALHGMGGVNSDMDTDSDSSDGSASGDDNYTGFDSESVTSSIFSSGGAAARSGNGSHQAMTHRYDGPNSIFSPASHLSRSSVGRRQRGTNNPSSSSLGAHGYDSFSAGSLVSQSSLDSASPSRTSPLPRGIEAALRPIGVDTRRGGGDVDSTAAVPAPSTVGSGYDQFSSKSLASNGSFGSISDLSIPTVNGGGGGGGGGGRNGDCSPTAYNKFVDMTSWEASGKSVASSASTRATDSGLGRNSTSSSTAGTFGGASDSSVAAKVPMAGDARRKKKPSRSKLWPTIVGSVEPATGAAVGGGGGSDGDGATGAYESFALQQSGYDDFAQDAAGDSPPPRELVSGYDEFQVGSDRSIVSSSRGAACDSKRSPSPQRPPAAAPAAVIVPSEPKDVFNAKEMATKPDTIPVEKAPFVDRNGGRNGSPTPLSPDALTAFSNADPEAKDRNRDVTEATQFLLTVLVPATARLLCSMPPTALAKINLASELHKYGVNIRHIGLLRAYITPSGASTRAKVSGSTGKLGTVVMKDSTAIMRDRALVEVVVRTLKLVLRGFQRSWMKSEKSASEQGMHMLVAEFLNLVTGSHVRSGSFWRENVTTGLCQRFGTVALTKSERAELWGACSKQPGLLLKIVKELVKVTGVRFKESVNQKLRSRKTPIVGFKFRLGDIRDIEAVVTPMAIYP